MQHHGFPPGHKGTGHQQYFGASGAQGLVDRWKAHIVADGQAHIAQRRVAGHGQTRAGTGKARFFERAVQGANIEQVCLGVGDGESCDIIRKALW